MREFTDMDFIIDVTHVEAITALIQSEGYHCESSAYLERFPVRFLDTHKDICFQKPCPRGGLFSLEFHYRPVKYMMDMPYGFADILGADHLSSTRPLSQQQYYELMLLNHGGSDHYPDLRSLLDLALLSRTDTGPVPVQLQRFETLWQLLSAQLLQDTNLDSVVSADNIQLKLAARLTKRLLTASPRRKPAFLKTVHSHITSSRGIKAKYRLLLKALQFLLLPNENDIADIKLPYFSWYYVTKPFRLMKGILRSRI
jgi:hypothetical protein